MIVLDRVKLAEDYLIRNIGTIAKKGTIGTIREIANDFATIQVDSDKLPIQIIVPNIILDYCNEEDLNKANYESLTPRIYHCGNLWSIRIGYDNDNSEIYKTGIILDYILTTNEENDKIFLMFLDDLNNNELNKKHMYTKKYLNMFGSYTTIYN